ncbi:MULTISPECIES: hypothetical protein [Paracoccus]|jgi:hypothetical protein|uniref:hypothetical protein n=1 Tax=Paracoccus TaxID=265 RepID=UPI000CEBD1EC|nr:MULTISPECIES: hypothetical protein [Paracoccus]UFS66595.1 hypothetical protein LO749_19005 [Paracoccus denitrificans]
MSPGLRSGILGISGLLPAGAMLATVLWEYSASPPAAALAGGFALAGVIAFSLADRTAPIIFVLVGIAMAGAAVATRPDWFEGTWTAVERGSFVVALYTALTAIRIAAMGSGEIVECGRFLAGQRPGLRYVALTIGGHLFGLILLYGSIALLGSLAAESTAREADAELRRHRLRRMLVAINRGFAATLCWSPLGFSMAITLTLVPGADWSAVVVPCLLNAVLMILVGWGLDTVFKPRLAQPAPVRAVPAGGWLLHLRPLLLLLGAVVVGVALLHEATGVDVIGAVMSFAPIVAIAWIWLQGAGMPAGRLGHVGHRLGEFLGRELPAYGGQIVLLFMAAFIGSLGAFLLVPLTPRLGLDFSVLPPLLIVVAMVWLVPLAGQLGMNPILSVSLIVPLLPSPAAMGIHPAALVAAITGGWAISGTTSPFTASVLLVGSYGGVPAREAGLRWNGPYALLMGCTISVWVLILAAAM